uniref:Uncharacterized protein n=1 Tax=Amphora coffeiformis TaxID=265554 RepID=A0A7S3L4I0_9STRA|mmetsp:Transcript_14859/g.28342  ORF Transcript_14859/g.28342 Transcript_14859/m.28342 type:complete len:142 (+) Transcript_14859:68-493(+)|eukprot:scaffold44484_cov183-Amphora_coffeaeformis.AAC.2
MADNSNKHTTQSPPHSPRVPKHATQMLPEELTPRRRAALKVPLHATQVLPDVLLHAKEELSEEGESSPVAPESNFVNFEKHILANHIGSLGDCMIYNKETHHASTTQTTPSAAPKDKVRKEDLMKSQSGSFDYVECFYTDH